MTLNLADPSAMISASASFPNVTVATAWTSGLISVFAAHTTLEALFEQRFHFGL